VSDGARCPIEEALEAAGTIFIEENGQGPGLRLRKKWRAAGGPKAVPAETVA
jgi:hypothetical protein